VKILHILSERGYSGGEHQLEALVRHLASQGHDNRFLLQPGAAFGDVVRGLGMPVTETRMRNGLDFLAARAISRCLRRDPVDLVQLACSRSHKIAGLTRLLPGKVPPFVVTRRMDYPIKTSPYRRWLYGRAVDAVVAISEGVRQEVLRLGVLPDHVHLIHDGVATTELGHLCEPDLRTRARRALELSDSDLLGVTLASLHERKGQDVLLEALAQVRVPAGRRLHWFLGGEGPLQEPLREQARQLVAGRPKELSIHIPGERVEPASLLPAADLFCLPSRREGLGVALLEAMAVGIPVVASRVGGMVEAFVDGESGLHVEVADPAGLAEALSQLLNDPDLARELGRAGRARVEAEFDIRRMCECTEALYRELAAKERGR